MIILSPEDSSLLKSIKNFDKFEESDSFSLYRNKFKKNKTLYLRPNILLFFFQGNCSEQEILKYLFNFYFNISNNVEISLEGYQNIFQYIIGELTIFPIGKIDDNGNYIKMIEYS